MHALARLPRARYRGQGARLACPHDASALTAQAHHCAREVFLTELAHEDEHVSVLAGVCSVLPPHAFGRAGAPFFRLDCLATGAEHAV